MAEKERSWFWSIGGFWDIVKDFFAAQFASVWGGFLSIFPSLLKQATNELKDVFGDIEEAAWWGMLESYKNVGMLTEDQLQNLIKLKDTAHPFDIAFYFAMQMKLFHGYIDATTEAPSNLVRQAAYKEHRPNLPEYRDILGAAFVAPEKTGEVREVMKKQGIPDDMIDLLFISVYRLYDENMIRTLFLRGVLSEDEMFIRMRELGYTDTRIKEMRQSWQIIPGPQDLFMMVAKEAFEPEFIEKIGLDDEFPVDQVQWLEKQGVSEFWAHKYWFAHWDQPSVGQGFEMLHRGVIDRSELDLLFRAVEIPPFWREKLTKIAFNPYTRVDTRRMHDMGVLTDSELVTAYMDQGYDITRARKMSEFTKKYNQQSQKDLTKGQILGSYIDNIISREDAKALLIKIDFPEPQAEFNLAYEEFKRDKKLADMRVKNIGDKYKLRLAGDFETRLRLNQQNLSGERIDVLMETWHIDRYEDMKMPSKTDLDKFYRNKIIDPGKYREEMSSLGYKNEYIDWYEGLLKIKKVVT